MQHSQVKDMEVDKECLNKAVAGFLGSRFYITVYFGDWFFTTVKKTGLLLDSRERINELSEWDYDQYITEVSLDIDYFLMDDVLTPEEDVLIRQALITPIGNTTAEQILARDKEGYAEVAYKLGVAYFYCYDDDGNKQLSRKWLDIAAEQKTLSESKQIRAEKLGTIAQYYSKMDEETVVSKSGDTVVKYKQFWDDLCTIADGNIAEEDNAVTAMMIYGEIAHQVYDNSGKLMSAGVTYEDMNNEIDYCVSHIESDISSDPELSKSEKEMVSKTLNNFALAKAALDIAAGGNSK